jgi:hypothetical protein
LRPIVAHSSEVDPSPQELRDYKDSKGPVNNMKVVEVR